jgi:putative transposase
MPSVRDRQRRYPSDLTDAQWEVIRSLIPSARRGGRPRRTNIRDVVDGILYLVSTGCAWRYLPRCFPPWKTTYDYYSRWTVEGIWLKIHDNLRAAVRSGNNRNCLPSYMIIDSQSVRAPSGEQRGFDGFKRVTGRKRQIIVDTMGLVHGVHVHSADLSDTKEGSVLAEKMSLEYKQRLNVMHADQGYRGTFEGRFYSCFRIWPLINARENTGQGKKKTAAEKKNWKKNRPEVEEKKRWVVERTFAWFNNYRRLRVDYEKKVLNSESMIYLAMTRLMLRRLHPS